jgi:hypothetical protein
MKIIKLLQEEINKFLTPAAQDRASTSFARLMSGSLPTPRSPLYKGLTEEQVFARWNGELDTFRASDVTLHDLIDYDQSKMKKVGPQGGLRPFKEREGDFQAYYTTPIEMDESTINSEAINEAKIIAFGGNTNKRPRSYEKVLNQDRYDNKLVTNSGCTEFSKRNDPNVISEALHYAVSGKWESLPMILFSRSQRQSERFVFGAPFSLNLVEKSFIYPMMDTIRSISHPFFSAWEGFSQVEIGLRDSNFFSEGHTYIQQDFVKMDKHVNTLQMRIVELITLDFWQPLFQSGYSNVLSHVLLIEVLVNLDTLYTGTHGMPSGSGLTNFAESLINLYIMLSYSYYGIEVVAIQGLGDDGILAIKRNGKTNDEILDVMQKVSASVGQVINPEKQGISEHTTVYLQRFFDDRLPRVDGKVLGMYPSILSLNTAMNPERYHDASKWSKEMEILRWIMILENSKNLPYFENLIQFFIKGDKYRLGLDLPDFFITLPSLYEKSQDIKGFLPTYNQESLDRGILDFETVKYLKELAR